MNKKSAELFYRNMDLLDLLQTVCKDIKNFLNEKDDSFTNEKIKEHFVAANELLSRVEVQHSCHVDNGENILTSSNYGINEALQAARELEDMQLPDGKIVAVMTLGLYHAARSNAEVNWL